MSKLPGKSSLVNSGEFWFTICLILIGIAGLVYSLTLPLMGPVALCPGLFPGVVTSLMLTLGLVRFFQMLRTKEEQSKNGEKEENTEQRSILIIIAFFLMYLLLLVYTHFLISTSVFLFLSMFYLYRKMNWKIPVVSVITTLSVFYLFRYLLNVRLP